MKRSLTVFAIVFLSSSFLLGESAAATFGSGEAWKVSVGQEQASRWEYPVRLIIPAIGLNIPIQQVGVNTKGEMDVPDSRTMNAGWYRDGTIPGRIGSAVLAAHVYAAFSSLRSVPAGSDVYVVTEGNSTLHFTVDEAKTYRLDQLSPQTLFSQNDGQRLNLITCAGRFIPGLGTYDERLVLHARLVSGHGGAHA
jgi:sortase (surface protein transpeptidase)